MNLYRALPPPSILLRFVPIMKASNRQISPLSGVLPGHLCYHKLSWSRTPQSTGDRMVCKSLAARQPGNPSCIYRLRFKYELKPNSKLHQVANIGYEQMKQPPDIGNHGLLQSFCAKHDGEVGG